MRIFILLLIIVYSSFNTRGIQNVAQEVKAYNLQRVDTLVDIGCGDGFFDATIAHDYPDLFFILEDLEYLKHYTKKEVVTDSSNTARWIKSHLKNSAYTSQIESHFQFIIGLDDTIPLPSGKFTRVLCRRSLHEFRNKEKMASELARLLSRKRTLTIAEVQPKYPGQRDPGCKQLYLTKDNICQMFKTLHLKTETSIFYRKATLNILDFSKD
jgi:ubiquinone/menaquinone biosynthesis C-methylase UbiE